MGRYENKYVKLNLFVNLFRASINVIEKKETRVWVCLNGLHCGFVDHLELFSDEFQLLNLFLRPESLTFVCGI